jgi:protein-arginine kinase activator protein McsA
LGRIRGVMEKTDVDPLVVDDRIECQDCGKALAETVQMGRRWCKECWEAFARDYEQFLLFQDIEER